MATKEGKYTGTSPWRTLREAACVSRVELAKQLGLTLYAAWKLDTGKVEATSQQMAAARTAVAKMAKDRAANPVKATAQKATSKRATKTSEKVLASSGRARRSAKQS